MQTVETRESWRIAVVSLVILGISWAGPWLSAVGLKQIAADLGGERSAPALAGALAWFGSGLGGVAMGRIAERLGVRTTVVFGALMIATGLLVSTLGRTWQLYLGHGLLMGLIGNAGINAPLYIYVSRWFDRRRGSALALISSGVYIAGAIWPPVFERAIASLGWQRTMTIFGGFEAAIIVPLALIFLHRPPEQLPAQTARQAINTGRTLGWNANLVLGLIAVAAFTCCVPMAMPQQHLVAFCTDLGIPASAGAAMLSVLLGTAFVSRQAWGFISDRLGGLATVLLGSVLQVVAMVAFLFTQDEIGLFTVAGLYGLGFSGIVPAYVLAIRDLFAAREASWRVPIVLLCNNGGMAFGSWFAGRLYDAYGFYAPAFAAGIAFNAVNLVVVAIVFLRQQRAGALAAGAIGERARAFPAHRAAAQPSAAVALASGALDAPIWYDRSRMPLSNAKEE